METVSGQEDSAVPGAATVVLLREIGGHVECLMLRKNAGQAFGGMWVFPGGRVEEIDGGGAQGARQAAVREAMEETGLVLDPPELIPFSHWMPPLDAPRRFATWFFVAPLPDGASDVVIDGGEIGDQMWTTAAGALQRHRAREIRLVAPTWVTLRWLSAFDSVEATLSAARAGEVERFATRMVDDDGVMVALWQADAGYASGDPRMAGPRHRLRMEPDGWVYERR